MALQYVTYENGSYFGEMLSAHKTNLSFSSITHSDVSSSSSPFLSAVFHSLGKCAASKEGRLNNGHK